MKVIIDINEDVYTRLFDNGTEDQFIAADDLRQILRSIRRGTMIGIDVNRADGDFTHRW